MHAAVVIGSPVRPLPMAMPFREKGSSASCSITWRPVSYRRISRSQRMCMRATHTLLYLKMPYVTAGT